MKTASAKRRSTMKSGSVSLAEARAAARIAKAERPARVDTRASAVSESRAWDLYLGHFGSSPGRSGARKSSAKKTSGKKAGAAKKSSSRKKR